MSPFSRTANWFSAKSGKNVAVTIRDSLSRGDSRDSLRRELRLSLSRWALAAVSARPARAVLADDTADLTDFALDVVGITYGQKPTRVIGAGKHGVLTDWSLSVLTSDHWALRPVSDAALEGLADVIHGKAENRAGECISRSGIHRLYKFLAKRRDRLRREQE